MYPLEGKPDVLTTLIVAGNASVYTFKKEESAVLRPGNATFAFTVGVIALNITLCASGNDVDVSDAINSSGTSVTLPPKDTVIGEGIANEVPLLDVGEGNEVYEIGMRNTPPFALLSGEPPAYKV